MSSYNQNMIRSEDEKIECSLIDFFFNLVDHNDRDIQELATNNSFETNLDADAFYSHPEIDKLMKLKNQINQFTDY